jgi:hypothetical protein
MAKVAQPNWGDPGSVQKYAASLAKAPLSVPQSATPTLNTEANDVFTIVGLAQAITGFTVVGAPNDADEMVVRITDNGTARAITWGSKFEASTVALPTTTVINQLLTCEFQFNGVTGKWRITRAV